MYTELCKKDSPKFLDVLIIVFVSFGLLHGFNWIIYKIFNGSSYTDLLTIIFMTYLIYYIIRRYIMTYKYTIIEDELIIQKKIGGKEKTLIDINVNQIKEIKEIKEIKVEKTNRIKRFSIKGNIFWNNCKNKNMFSVKYIEDGNENEFEFQPSDKMMNIINKRMMQRTSNFDKNSEII